MRQGCCIFIVSNYTRDYTCCLHVYVMLLSECTARS